MNKPLLGILLSSFLAIVALATVTAEEQASTPTVQSITLQSQQVLESNDVVMRVNLSSATQQPTEFYFKLLTSESEIDNNTYQASIADFQPMMMFSYRRPIFNVEENEWQGVINLARRNSISVPAGVSYFNIRFAARYDRRAEDATETAGFSVSSTDNIDDGQTVDFSVLDNSAARECGVAKMSYILPKSFPAREGDTLTIDAGLNQTLQCARVLKLQLVEGANFYPYEEGAVPNVDFDANVTLRYNWFNPDIPGADTTEVGEVDLSTAASISLPKGTYEFQLEVDILNDTQTFEPTEFFNLFAWFEDDAEREFLAVRDLSIAEPLDDNIGIVSVTAQRPAIDEGQRVVSSIVVNHGNNPADMRIGIGIEDNSTPNTNLTASSDDYSNTIEVSLDATNWTAVTLNNSNFINYTIPADNDTVYVRIQTLTDDEDEQDENFALSAWYVSETQSSYKFDRITILAPTTEPAEAADDNVTLDEDNATSINVLDNDTGTDIEIISFTQPASGTVTQSGQQLIYTPEENFNGSDEFSYTIQDADGGTDSATVSLTINAVNDAPNFVDDQASTDEDTAVTVNVLDNDTDADNDTLTVTAVTLSDPNAGTVSFTPDGQVTFTPAENFTGNVTITYTATDGTVTGTGSLTITVNNENDAPEVNDDTFSIDEDSSNNILDVLANDTDPDGDTLNITSVSVSTGTYTLVNGQIQYTPPADFVGTVTLNYTASDGTLSDSATATITVNNANNDAPVVNNDAFSIDEDSSNNVLDVLANDSDPDGDTLSISNVTVSAGTYAIVNGQIQYTPPADFIGTVTLNYTATDGSLSGSATATITVNNANNDAPIVNDDTFSIDEDSSNNVLDVLANDSDPDGDALSITNVTVSAGTYTVVNGQIQYTPPANFIGTVTLTYTASDGEQSGSATATITVNNANNDAPTANDDTFSIDEDSSNNALDVLANDTDPDNDNLAITQISVSTGTYSLLNGQIQYTPPANFIGTVTLNYTASDGTLSDSATATITVNNANNDAPVVNNDAFSIDEDSSNNVLDVLANDSDPDGDALSISNVTVSAGTYAIVNGQIQYTPPADFIGTVTLNYTATDGSLSGSATATITVNNTNNDAPIVNDDTFSIDEDSSNNVLDVLANDSDPDGDALSITNVTVSAGTYTVVTGQIQYTPPADFVGTVTLTYTASDGEQSGSATATITVNNANNDAPVVNNDTFSIDEDSSNNVLDVLANDSDPDGDALSITNVTVSTGTYSIVNGQLLYTPPANYIGTVTLNYTASDGSLSGSATATITVNNANNDAPLVNNDTFSIDEDSSNNVLDVLANDSDPDGDALSITNVTVSAGTYSIVNGQVLYTPPANYIGTVTLNYTASDGSLSGSASATITVNNANNDAPVVNNDTFSIDEDSSNNVLDVLANDSDPDGDALSITNVTVSTGTYSIVNGQILYTPPANYIGTVTLNYTASDGSLSGSATATITVNNANNDAPIINDDTFSIDEDSSNNVLDVLTNDSDPDGDALSITNVTVSAGTYSIVNGQILYTPPANYIGTVTLNYTASDGSQSGSATATITVNNANNDAPIANDDLFTINEDSSNNILDVLANDTDADNDTLAITNVSVSTGTFSVISGQILYTPPADFIGTVTLTYSASDGEQSDSATATITVSNSNNDAPVANNDSFTINEDSSNNALDVLANDTDADGDSLSITNVSVSTGSYSISNGRILYTPPANYTGTVTLYYTASDGSLSDTASATITVNNSDNDAPVANDDAFTINEDSSNNAFNVLANDTDPEGANLTVTAVDASSGTATISNNQVVFTPTANFSGVTSIEYTVSDGNSTDTATITVTVSEVNDAPNAVDDSYGYGQLTVTASNYTGDSSSFTKIENGTNLNDDYQFIGNIHNDGSYAVVWRSWDGSYHGNNKVYLQRFNADGSEKGTRLRLGSRDKIENPRFSANPNTGDILVTWTGYNNSANLNTHEYMQLIRNDDSRGPEVDLGTSPLRNADSSWSNNTFLVTWQVAAGLHSGGQVYYQLVNQSTGQLVGSSTLISNTAANSNGYRIGANVQAYTLDNGNFVVMMNNTNQSMKVQLISPQGAKIGSLLNLDIGGVDFNERVLINLSNDQFAVIGAYNSSYGIGYAKINANTNALIAGSKQSLSPNTYTHDEPHISQRFADGRFYVSWRANTGTQWRTFVQYFDANGDKSGNYHEYEVVPGQNGGGHSTPKTIVTSSNGDYFLALASVKVDNYDIYVQKYSASGTAIGESFKFTGEAANVNDLGIRVTNIGNNGSFALVFGGQDSAANGGDLSIYMIHFDANGNPSVHYPPNGRGDFTINTSPISNSDYQVTYGTGDLQVAGVSYATGSTIAKQTWDSANANNSIKLVNAVGADFDLRVSGLIPLTTTKNTPISVLESTLLQNDTDIDSTNLTVTGVSNPVNGTVTRNNNGTITFTPSLNFIGTARFDYSISDGEGGSDSATVTIVVSGTNSTPNANNDSFTVDQDSSNNTLNVLANDSDADGDSLSISAAGSGANGTVSINSNNTLSYTPVSGFTGTDTFSYTVTDGSKSAQATVTVTVEPPSGSVTVQLCANGGWTRVPADSPDHSGPIHWCSDSATGTTVGDYENVTHTAVYEGSVSGMRANTENTFDYSVLTTQDIGGLSRLTVEMNYGNGWQVVGNYQSRTVSRPTTRDYEYKFTPAQSSARIRLTWNITSDRYGGGDDVSITMRTISW